MPVPVPARAPARIEPLRPLPAIGLLFLCLFLGAAGLGITYLGSTALINAARLTFGGELTDATVTDARVMESSRSGLSYEVRYSFGVPGDPNAYTCEDETGRTNLWASLADEPTWRAATSTRRLQVQYLPSDPHVSRPVAGTGASFGGDQAAGLCLGLALLIPSLLVALGTMWGQIKRMSGR